MSITGLIRKICQREVHHPVLTYPLFLLRVVRVRLRYRRTRARLRQKLASGAPVKVVFLCMDTAKWKCQSLYDLLRESPLFKPVVALTRTDEGAASSPAEISHRNNVARVFFERMGCEVVDLCEPDGRGVVSPLDIGADIVFYQVPWGNLSPQTVWEVSRSALCCYVPYSIETVVTRNKSRRFNFDHFADFHALMFAIFQWSEAYARSYRRALLPWEWAGPTLGFGHPTLDVYAEASERGGNAVVYAPHFAFAFRGLVPILNIGTFPWSGQALLDYARKHPEIEWVFKPHHKLRQRLVEIGYMTIAEVDAYYRAWEQVGTACYDGDYARYFLKSRAMITDSNSFLMEYMAVGQPLIHLVPRDDNTLVCREAEAVFRTFYVAHDEEELAKLLRLVVEERGDPTREARCAAAREAAVLGNHAGRRIFNWLGDMLRA